MPARKGGHPVAWYKRFNIDLFLPGSNDLGVCAFYAWMIPLMVLARGASLSDRLLTITACGAIVVSLVWTLAIANRRLAYGPAREIQLSEEVVVITGGASGLGLLLAETFGMRGASVAVLDLKEQDEAKGVSFYKCDVSERCELEDVANRITDELGTPTILINNAGVVNGKRLLDLSSSEIDSNFRVNLLAHFHTIQVFLPKMVQSLTGGTIVTISSVLAHLGAARLSDYTAAKSGLIAMHASLRAELNEMTDVGAKNVRTILVTPGQLGTDMFEGVETPSSFFGPIVEPLDLVKKIVDMVQAGYSGELSIPAYARYIKWYGVLPASLQRVVRWMSGVDKAMAGFKKPAKTSDREE
ncbi:putative short-chain dehydrogenase/reductase family protein [Viridothelium virens]|uniref:Putative short-chain dehydrogenase/reductase family protein n=1 Tax=Viridothelium virens TaxID=1048519 RepID=A0A6A6HL35_VIRVR|nr:putative short-chain dehydrogenase/reductase family protein [Viridothelium virens]